MHFFERLDKLVDKYKTFVIYRISSSQLLQCETILKNVTKKFDKKIGKEKEKYYLGIRHRFLLY